MRAVLLRELGDPRNLRIEAWPPEDFTRMLEMYAKGLHPIVDSVVPLEDAAHAHARLESGEQFGKIVLRI
jgi:NADPH:quinone reductase-like Zn-dependent oxidoreductase